MEKQKNISAYRKIMRNSSHQESKFFNGKQQQFSEKPEHFFHPGGAKQKTGNLPDNVLTDMGRLFQEDFSNVTVHQNSETTKNLNAVAYTQGDEVHFAPGYDPYSSQGREFLGHELAHVIQQRSGRVETTHQELNLNVNNDNVLESEANEAGKRVSAGQPVNKVQTEPHGPAVFATQKKTSAVQLLRLLPAGAPIFELNVWNVDEVLKTFASLWNRFDSFGWLTTSFYKHEDLPDVIKGVLGSNYFRGSNVFVSDWYDDGSNDWWNLGELDNDVRIVMSFYIDNEKVVDSGSGTFSSGGTTTDTRTTTTTTTVGGGATISAAPPGATGGVGGNVTASGSVSKADSRSMAVAGTSGLSMTSPAQIKSADVLIKCELKVNPSLMSIKTVEKFSGVAGTLRFGAPI